MRNRRNPYLIEALRRKGGSHNTSKKDEEPCRACKGAGEIPKNPTSTDPVSQLVPCWLCSWDVEDE